MSLLDRLLRQLEQRGLSVGPGDSPGELKLHGPRAEATPEILKALKAFKPQLLQRYGRREAGSDRPHDPQSGGQADPDPDPQDYQTCPECGRETDAEDRERLAGVNPLCSRGYARAVRDGNGVWHEASTPCPYRRS